MLKLRLEQITIITTPMSKEAAIRHVADLLLQKGFVKPGYAQGMLDREFQITTYLENGIAIPHGTIASQELVNNTGVEVVFHKQAVDWGEGNQVHLVVGIAAKSDEHLDILRNLTTLLTDNTITEKFARIQEVRDVLHLFLTDSNKLDNIPEALISGHTAKFTIHNANGLHARPCAELIKQLKKWDNNIQVRNLSTGSAPVNAKSMMKMMSLGVKKEHVLEFIVDGQDAQNVLKSISEAIVAMADD